MNKQQSQLYNFIANRYTGGNLEQNADGSIIVSLPGKPWIVVQMMEGACYSLFTVIEGEDITDAAHFKLLQLVCILSKESSLAKWTVDDKGNIKGQALISGPFNATAYTPIFDRWDNDIDLLIEALNGLSKTANANSEAPSTSDKFAEIGTSLNNQTKYPEAVEAFTQAIDLDPNNLVAIAGRADALFKLRKKKAALADVNLYLELETDKTAQNRVFCLMQRALNFAHMYMFAEAVDDITEIIKVRPQESAFPFNRALFYNEWQKWDEAISDCELALKLDSKNCEALTLKGEVYLKGKNDRELGIKYLELAADMGEKRAKKLLKTIAV